MSTNEKSRWDILNERGAKERDKYKKDQEEKKKKEAQQKAKDEKRKAEQDKYNQAKKRTEQMTREEYIKRRQAGESMEDLKNEYMAYQTDQRLATPGGAASQPTTQELAMMAAAEHYGNPSNNERLSSAVKAYKMLEGEARRILQQNRSANTTPDEEYDNNFINMYIEAMYNNPDVSLDTVRNTMQAMKNNNEQSAEVAGRDKKMAEFAEAAARAYTPTGLPNPGIPAATSGLPSPYTQPAVPTEPSSGWMPSKPMPQVPNSGDPTLPYMNTGTESTGYKPITFG